MKVFWLRLLGTDFVADGDEFVSGVIDVYENSIFRNLSVTRSQYGSDLLGNNIWTGLEPNGAGDASETGKIVDTDRWLDTSGRIDVINFRVNNWSSDEFELKLFSSDLTDDSQFRDEWAEFGPIQTHEPLNAIDIERNVKVVIGRWRGFWTDELIDVPDDAEFLLRVEIGKPTMVPFYRMAKEVLNRYPEWMDMRELENQPDGELATPNSLGAQFVNAIAGEWLDDQRVQMKQAEYQLFIDTVDLDQLAWAYETEINNDPLWSVTGDGIELSRAADWNEFIEAPDDHHVCFIDYEENAIFSRQEYDDFQLNEETQPQSPYHVWNFVDELGLLVDLERHDLEDNETFRWRILDVYRNRGGGGRENFLNAVRRELNLWQSHGISPDPQDGFPDEDADGNKVAVPEILDMQDIENDREDPDSDEDTEHYFTVDGLPTRKFVRLVNRLSWEYPATWGRFQWDRAVWDIAADDFRGFSTTPNRYDGEQVPEDFVQYGVGDLEDLKLEAPTTYLGAREFTAQLIARGFSKQTVIKYMPVQVDLEIYGEGVREEFDNPTKTTWFSLEVDTPDGVFVHSFQMSAKSDVDAITSEPTPSSFDEFDPFDEIELTTRHDLSFVDKDTEEPYDGDGIIPIDQIDSFTLIQGELDAGSYGKKETSDTFEAWFTTDDDNILTFDSGSVAASEVSDSVAPEVIFKSKVTNSLGDQPWRTDPFEAEVEVNDTPDHEQPEDTILQLPEFVWGEGVTDRNIIVQLRISRLSDQQDPDSELLYGAFFEEDDGSTTFIDSSHIEVNAVSAWTTDGNIALAESTSELTVSTIDSTEYPQEVREWLPEKWTSTTQWDGVVDRIGPWRDGEPQREVGAHSRWVTLDQLTRDDFEDSSGNTIPHDEDHVVTRMHAEVTEQSVGQGVVVWLNSQVVESDADFRDLFEYPDNAIREFEDSGAYKYDPFVIHARLISVPNEDWNPYMHSGFFFDGIQEYYVFADERVETTSSSLFELNEVAQQGAPIIVQATAGDFTKNDGFLEEVAFPDENFDLTLLNEERIEGNGTTDLFLAYADVYNISVEEWESGDAVAIESDTASDNVVHLQNPSDPDIDYRITYNVYGTFIVDRHSINQDAVKTDDTEALTDDQDVLTDSGNPYPHTRVEVDPKAAGEITEYTVHYEGASQNPYTEADVALNPMKTIRNEGYIFIGRQEYTLHSLAVEATPTKLIADGEDYMLLSIQCLDEHGNPKPDQQVELSSTFGTFDTTTLTVDRDGFVMAILTADAETDTLHGELTVTAGDLTEVVEFDIEPDLTTAPRLFAAPTTNYITADGENHVKIYGRTMLSEHEPAANVEVNWKRARHLRNLFVGSLEEEGIVQSDSNGHFEIGPLIVAPPDDPGYWFVSTEATIDGELVGDVVFWFEFAEHTFAVESATGMPSRGMEFKNPPGTIHPFANEAMFPYGYDEEDPEREKQDIRVRWLPPRWFPLPKYRQYQLGLFTDDQHHSTDSDEVLTDDQNVLTDSGAAFRYTTYVTNVRPFVQDI